MKINSTKLKDVYVVDAEPREDSRGSFARWFGTKELAAIIGSRPIVQVNHSINKKTASIRGMHFQKEPHAEVKFVRCIKGKVWDVALDLRAGSKTFLQYHAEELSAENNKMLVIPEGCAHGFQVLQPGSELLYLHTGSYEPSSEGGVNYADPKAAIQWPLPVGEISDRDAKYPFLSDDFQGL
jgi:dTDP-4-dehydrorhamnose 3,5-epimerase